MDESEIRPFLCSKMAALHQHVNTVFQLNTLVLSLTRQ